MKQALLLLLVFAAAFAATMLFMSDVFRSEPIALDDPANGTTPPHTEDDLTARRRAEITRTMIGVDEPAAGGAPVDAGASEAPGRGEILGTVKTDDALVPESLSVWVRPAEAEPMVTGGGTFRIGDLPPGTYHVGVAAKGYVPRPPTEVVVQAGRKVAVEIPLARGLELRGIVVEDVDQRPIQGVRIDFNGIVQAQSDAYGAFSTGLVPPKALEVVTLTHDDYDRHRVVHPVILEPQNIVLAMGRGKGTVTGRIIPPSDGALPARIQVRNWRVPMAGHEELRRELTLENASSFEIRGVFSGPHVLEVAFPGSTIVSRRIEYDLGSDPTRHVDVDLSAGGAVEGVYTAPSNVVAGRQVHLIDTGNHEVGETRTDEKGRFRFDRVPAGEFAIRMGSRIPPLHTQPFQVEDGRVAQIVVDGQTGRLR